MSRRLLAAVLVGCSLYGCASSCDGHDDPQSQPTVQNTPEPASSRSRINRGPHQPLMHMGDLADK